MVARQALIEGRAPWPIGFGREWTDRRYDLWRRIPLFDRRAIKQDHSPEMLIVEGLQDLSAAVRRMAADALVERRATFPGLDAIVVTMAADRSPAVRERAEFIVRKRAEAVAARQPT